MELSFGFGREMRLLYRAAEDRSSMLIYQLEIARTVNATLFEAYAKMLDLIRRNRTAIGELARALLARDTLEGTELRAVFTRLGKLIAAASARRVGSHRMRHANGVDVLICEHGGGRLESRRMGWKNVENT